MSDPQFALSTSHKKMCIQCNWLLTLYLNMAVGIGLYNCIGFLLIYILTLQLVLVQMPLLHDHCSIATGGKYFLLIFDTEA